MIFYHHLSARTTEEHKHMSDVITPWYRVLDLDELPDGRVNTVVVDHKSLALTHAQGHYGALDNRCLHQGDP